MPSSSFQVFSIEDTTGTEIIVLLFIIRSDSFCASMVPFNLKSNIPYHITQRNSSKKKIVVPFKLIIEMRFWGVTVEKYFLLVSNETWIIYQSTISSPAVLKLKI